MSRAKAFRAGETVRYRSHVIEKMPDQKDDVFGFGDGCYVVSGPFMAHRDKDFYTLDAAQKQVDDAIQHTRLVLADIDGTVGLTK